MAESLFLKEVIDAQNTLHCFTLFCLFQNNHFMEG